MPLQVESPPFPLFSSHSVELPSPAADSVGRVRKRDPRLVCLNYLAGVVPCSCPEVDEKVIEAEKEVVVGARKRARSGGASVGVVRCQVPGCEADIRELKGYHKRHRVCLQCANASSVELNGETKRYCQQCGNIAEKEKDVDSWLEKTLLETSIECLLKRKSHC